LNNWGIGALPTSQDEGWGGSRPLFEEAGRKYAEALRWKPDHHTALGNWGNALSGWAKIKAGQESRPLLEEAGRKFAEALRLKPDNPPALNNWGAALIYEATMKRGRNPAICGTGAAEGPRSRTNARWKRRLQSRLRRSDRGKHKEAVRWLQVCKSSGERLSRTMIAAEKDFDRVRNQPEFVSLVESLTEIRKRGCGDLGLKL